MILLYRAFSSGAPLPLADRVRQGNPALRRTPPAAFPDHFGCRTQLKVSTSPARSETWWNFLCEVELRM